MPATSAATARSAHVAARSGAGGRTEYDSVMRITEYAPRSTIPEAQTTMALRSARGVTRRGRCATVGPVPQGWQGSALVPVADSWNGWRGSCRPACPLTFAPRQEPRLSHACASRRRRARETVQASGCPDARAEGGWMMCRGGSPCPPRQPQAAGSATDHPPCTRGEQRDRDVSLRSCLALRAGGGPDGGLRDGSYGYAHNRI